ncbi:MAG: ribonuclease HII [candidate division WOR-3 bacterium]
MKNPKKRKLKAPIDKKFWHEFTLIAGCDEAGRGPLAGPVVAAAVILPRDFYHAEIDDSKKLSPAKREKLYKVITDSAVSYAFGTISVEVIDKVNILEATKLAMAQAINGLSHKPEIVLIDALKIDNLPLKQFPIIKGDTLSISIASASILAKVKRDSIMLEYHKLYPVYGFDKHKGYPTPFHRECIEKYGPCSIHRRSFRLVRS